MALAVALLLSLSSASPGPRAPAAPAAPNAPHAQSALRVYVAPLVGSAGDVDTLRLIEDRVLVAARAAGGARVEIVGAADVRQILSA